MVAMMTTPYRVFVEKSFSANGIGIHLGRMTDQGLLVLNPIGPMEWSRVGAGIATPPAFYLDDGMARDLMEALVKHYDFNLDTSTARKDYLYERGRVDTLTAAVLDVLRQQTGT